MRTKTNATRDDLRKSSSKPAWQYPRPHWQSLIGLAATNAAAAKPPSRGNSGVRLDRVFIIVLENHSENAVIGDPNAPFITSLAQKYGEATNYFGVTHPSEPNYIAMTSGSNWFINNDNPANRFDHTNIVDQLEAAHISWGAYMEALPPNPLDDFWPSSSTPLYASKHNPFALYTDVRDNPARVAHIKPYTALAGDLNSPHAPRFVYIVPDQCNDMHGGVFTAVPGHPETPCPFGSTSDDPNDAALKQKADAFVKGAVRTIMSSRAWTPHSAIFVVADEGDFSGNPVNGGWDSPAGCCDARASRQGPGHQRTVAWRSLRRRASSRGCGGPERAEALRRLHQLQPLLTAAHHRGRLAAARAGLRQRSRTGPDDGRVLVQVASVQICLSVPAGGIALPAGISGCVQSCNSR